MYTERQGDKTMEKVTKEMQFKAIKAILEEKGETKLVAFIEHEIELVRKKNSRKSTGKPSKNAVENADLGFKAINVMETGTKYTVTQIQSLLPELSSLSNQRVSAIMKALTKTGLVQRTEEKGKAYFTKV